MGRATRAWKARGVAGAVVIFGAVITTAMPASAAPQCVVDLGAHTATLTPQTSVGLSIKADAGWLSVNDSWCIQLNNVNTVSIDMSPFPSSSVRFDLSGGPLGPGYTDEGNGSSEIEFAISGFGAGSFVQVSGTTGSDGISFGQHLDRLTGILTGQVNMNALADATQDADVSFTAFPERAYVYPGPGSDVVSGQGAGSLTSPFSRTLVIGDEGPGADQLTGGSGNDGITGVLEPGSAKVWSGGAGVDSLTLIGGGGSSASITLDGVANDGLGCPGPACANANAGADLENVAGGPASETIVGTAGPNLLIGGGGINVLKGVGGNDVLRATPLGRDTFRGGGGGKDQVTFAALPGPAGVTVTVDGVPNDGLPGQNSNVGTDVEIVAGSPWNDTLAGNAEANTLLGSIGADVLYGLGGDDVLDPGPHDDQAFGGPGTDTLSFASIGVAVTIDVGAATAIGQGFDAFAGFERYRGSPLGDVFTGGATKDVVLAGGGNDQLSGGDGDDTLKGQDGDDTFDGGPGTDRCVQGPGAGATVDCE